MGPKSFEQCAGFLKIPESAESLDNTWVHPENYGVARAIRETLFSTTTTGNLSSEVIKVLKEQHSVGDTTINDIVDELKKPNRDPRDSYPKPVTRKGVVTFEDLHEGMLITGKIKNVVDFGAFVDLGIKETALVHISEMSNDFVKDPMDVVKVGDVFEFRIISLDLDRKRIGLSRKTEPPASVGTVSTGLPTKEAAVGKKRVVVKAETTAAKLPKAGDVRPTPAAPPRRERSAEKPAAPRRPEPRERPRPDDDGTMYNPFAEALRKMKEKK
jgi:uncharacterized protein